MDEVSINEGFAMDTPAVNKESERVIRTRRQRQTSPWDPPETLY